MLSVIIPAFNEGELIEKAYYTISEILKNADIDNEIIFIDDGSSDDTYAKITYLSNKRKKFKRYAFFKKFR